jgi:hypothetical protein
MATYSITNFIQPGYEQSNQIRIRDKNGGIKLTIANNTGTVFYSKDNIVFIKTASEKNINKLVFANNVEAIQAVGKLKTAYGFVVKNYKDRNKPTVDPETVTFNSDIGNISNGQYHFPIPQPVSEIFIVSINGVIISTWSYDSANSWVEIDITELGYSIDTEDEVIIKYFE